MADDGFKISTPGVDATRARLQELVVTSSYPVLKCDLRPNPKHFGLIKGKGNVAVSVGESKTLFTLNHNYQYIPSFIPAWTYPPGDTSSATYGIGDLEISEGGDIILLQTRVSDNQFVVSLNNSSGSIAHSIYVSLRFYIFVDDFPLYTSIPVSLPENLR